MGKDIIINGIDVSECKYYDDEICCNEDVLALSCDKTDCIYKQLKRLQEENEKLRNENEGLKKEHYEVLKMLKHEYDGRKKDNEQWFQRCTENHNEDSKIINQYEQALKEIREMLKKSMSLKSNAYNHFINVEKAIDKIDEVLNENSQDN